MVMNDFQDYIVSDAPNQVDFCKVKFAQNFISITEARDDFQMLKYIMDNAYSGKDFWELHGLCFSDCYRVIESYINSQLDQISIPELCKVYHSAFCGIHDGHLAFISPRDGRLGFAKTYSAYFSNIKLEFNNDKYTVVESENNEVLPGQIVSGITDSNLFPTLAPKGRTFFLLGIRNWDTVPNMMVTINGKEKILPLHKCRAGHNVNESDSGVFRYENINDIDVVKSSRFWIGEEVYQKELADKFQELGRNLRERPTVIWDLHNNGGGSSSYPQKFIEGLNANAIWPVSCAVLSSPVTEQRNGCSIDIKDERKWTCYPSEQRDLLKSLYNGVLYLLINDGVGSSGEAAVSQSLNVKNCLLLGENTGGVGIWGDTLTYELPFTKMQMVVPFKLFLGGAAEGMGFAPDFWIDNDDLLSTTLKWIKMNEC